MPFETLDVVTLCAYLTDVGCDWREDDYKCQKMVKSLKGESFKGYFTHGRPPRIKKYYQVDSEEFLSVAGNIIGNSIYSNFGAGTTIVPIPNSWVINSRSSEFRTKRIAQAAAITAKAGVTPCLEFSSPQTPTHKGGTRDPIEIEKHYRVNFPTPLGRVVFLDDVFTSGSHIKAATWKLKSLGCVISGAICFARATKEQEEKPIKEQKDSISLSKGLFEFL